MDASDPEREIAYRRIHGLEAGMAGSGHAAEEQPRCCEWLVRCFRCFSGEPDESQNSTPRSRALESTLYPVYEAPQAPASNAPVVQTQRQSPAFVDDVDAGPLLPKTAESSAPLPRPTHSRNNSSASASAAAAACASAGEPLSRSSKRTNGAEGQGGGQQQQQQPVAAGEGASRSGHHRSGSYGEGWPRRPPKVQETDGNAAAAEAAAAVAASAAAAAAAAVASAVGAAAAASTAAGRPGAAFGPVQDEDDDFCPTCLDVYTTENPKIFTECGHHFHMPCIYAWLERKDTCPMCESPMQAPGM